MQQIDLIAPQKQLSMHEQDEANLRQVRTQEPA